MDILIVLVLLFVAWLGGHALDYIFNKVEKAIKPVEADEEIMVRPEKEIIYESGKAKGKAPGKQPARLYLVPSATSRH